MVYVPDPQILQVLIPVPLWNVPALQIKHVLESTLGWYVPGVQLVFTLFRHATPGGQSLHCQPLRGAEAFTTLTRPGKLVQLVPDSHVEFTGQMHWSTVLAPE